MSEQSLYHTCLAVT